ncbi:hypothetical protein TNCV_3119911 [Trichonephila clavipes]|uniref:Uncharacterized protein n=1 Tax=Trichonephila clavipes TaxID=2585209 RepID=A0A8X6WAQ4_TRICX|nr:hypothetical protein TNCV_3119911 [Trichonephila clavipes]
MGSPDPLLHGQDLTIDEFMYKQERGIEEPESLDPAQSENLMMIGVLIGCLSLTGNWL